MVEQWMPFPSASCHIYNPLWWYVALKFGSGSAIMARNKLFGSYRIVTAHERIFMFVNGVAAMPISTVLSLDDYEHNRTLTVIMIIVSNHDGFHTAVIHPCWTSSKSEEDILQTVRHLFRPMKQVVCCVFSAFKLLSWITVHDVVITTHNMAFLCR